MKSTLLSTLCLLLALRATAPAQIPERPQSWVSDYAGLLTPEQRQQLDQRLRDLEQRTSTQIFVAIFPALPENTYLEDFTIRLFEKWRPGLANEDNGLLLAVFVEDRRLRIEVGYGLEDVLTDAQASRVISQAITPRFREGNYFQGIDDGLDMIIAAVEGKYQIPVEQPRREGDGFLARHGPILIFIAFVFLILFNSWRRPPTTLSGKGAHRHGWGGPIIWGGSSRSGWGGGSWGGGGRGGGGGGGFSGGFGGSAGGGGASGSW